MNREPWRRSFEVKGEESARRRRANGSAENGGEAAKFSFFHWESSDDAIKWLRFAGAITSWNAGDGFSGTQLRMIGADTARLLPPGSTDDISELDCIGAAGEPAHGQAAKKGRRDIDVELPLRPSATRYGGIADQELAISRPETLRPRSADKERR